MLTKFTPTASLDVMALYAESKYENMCSARILSEKELLLDR